MRLQVEIATASLIAALAAQRRAARAAWRSVSATRSRSATGAAWCEMPTQQQLGHALLLLAGSRAASASSVSSPSSRSIRLSLPAMIAT